MATQTALAITEIGKPLTKITLPIPEPQDHQLLIKVTVAGLAPFDEKLRDIGLYNIGAELPAVISLDVVGTVVKHGPNTDATSFPIGSHVFSQGLFGPGHWKYGGLQQYTLIDSRFAAVVPSAISDTDAALFPVNSVTSFIGLFDDSGLGIPFPSSSKAAGFDYKAQTVLIIGGATNCGKLAIQLARNVGIGRIIAIAAGAREAELKKYGATHVIDRHLSESEVKKQVQDLVGDDLIYVYDTITRDDHSFGASLLSNSKKGILAHLLHGEKKIREEVVESKKGGFEEKQVFGAAAMHPELGTLFWKVYPEWIQSGKVEVLKYRIIEGLDLDKVNGALDEYRDGTASGERWHVRVS